MAQTDREMIEAWLRTKGQTAGEWRTGDDGRDEAVLPGKWRVVEDVNAQEGPFEGDEGEAIVSCVGGAEHGNLRVHLGFQAEGFDLPLEVSLDYLEPVD